jgi:archaemetzincin
MAHGGDGKVASTDIVVIPIGTVASGVANELAAALSEVFLCRAEPGEGVHLPLGAWNQGRGQYLSSAILAAVLHSKPADVSFLLGVTDCDLYLPQLNFVFGEADIARGIAVISVARLREEFYGHPPDAELFKRRIITEAVHEVGHALGFDHCPDLRCVMYFSNTLADTDRKGSRFCTRCREKFGQLPFV